MTLIEWLIVFYIFGFAFVFLYAMNYSTSSRDNEEGREDNDHNRKSN